MSLGDNSISLSFCEFEDAEKYFLDTFFFARRTPLLYHYHKMKYNSRNPSISKNKKAQIHHFRSCN